MVFCNLATHQFNYMTRCAKRRFSYPLRSRNCSCTDFQCGSRGWSGLTESCCWFCFATKLICSMMRCAQRRFQPSPNTPRPSLENHRGGLDGLGVFLHFDSNIEAKIPQKELRNWNTNKQKMRWDICRCSCRCSGYWFSSSATKHMRRNRFWL